MVVTDANYIREIPAFVIRRCADCGTSAMDPMPTAVEAGQIYVSENVFSQPRVFPNVGLRLSRILEPLWAKFGKDLRFVVKLCARFSARRNTLSVLDIGCSTGGLLATFEELEPSFRLTGVDIDPNSKLQGFPSIADSIQIGDVRTMQFGKRFDIITMRTVIEHLTEIMPYLDHVVGLMKDDGILFLATPDIASARARQLGATWKLINDTAQKTGHVLWFDRASLRKLAAHLGLEVAYLGNRGEAFEHFPRWLRRAMAAAFGRDPHQGRIIRWYVPRLVYSLVFDGLLSERLGWGDVMYAILRKPRTTVRALSGP
jgi:SAM-dependent methyltransferase